MVVREREGTEQPAPDGALMIGRVAVAGAAAVMAGISGFARREAAQPVRGQEIPRANIDNRFLLLGSERA